MLQKSYKSKRLELRPISLNDFNIWKNACLAGLPKKNKWDKDPPLPRKKIFISMIARLRKKARLDQLYVWGIFAKKNLVGFIDISIIERYSIQNANLGYKIFNHCWRQGYAFEALSEIIKPALRDLKLNRLEAVIDLDNKVSIALVKKLQFRKEGIRKNYWYQNNRWDDQVVYIVDRSELKMTPLKVE